MDAGSMPTPTRRLLSALLAVVIAACIGLVTSAVLNRAPDWPVGDDGDPPGNYPCKNNLSQLYMGMKVYVSLFGSNRYTQPHQGEMFWKCLAGECGDNTQHPESYFKRAPFAGVHDILICRHSWNRVDEPPGTISYRGPTESTLSEMRAALHSGQDLSSSPHPALPLACEKPGHHKNPGGWVLYTDGVTRFLSGPAFEDALRKTE
jgi:hypothetical protein